MFGLSAYEGLPFADQMLHGVHFMLCAFAVLVACVPLLTEKGSTEHKFAGMIYLPLSLGALAFASAIAWQEESLVLFCFNAFCAYLLLSGWRAVHEKDTPAAIDWMIPAGLFLLAAFVTLHALIYDEGKTSLYLLFFAGNGFVLAGRDWKHLRRRAYWLKRKIFLADAHFGARPASEWLGRHIAGMVGSLMANLSVVVLTLLPIELHWLWPATLIVLAGWIALQQHRKKARVRKTVAAVLHPKFRPGIVREPVDDDVRRAA